MAYLTAALIGALVAYCGAWYLGYVAGDFELLLFVATMVTGLYWLAERFIFLPRRRARAAGLRQHPSSDAVVGWSAEGSHKDANGVLAQPWWLDWTAGLFPVILIVFLLRSFVFEPFKIPSGSMIPTLHIGDFILVNKYSYGLKLPVLGTRLTQGREIQRGDVVVFRYPPDPRIDYIKRVVGLPGDTVSYENKRLMINGQQVPEQPLAAFFDESTVRYFEQYQEELPERTHRIIINPDLPTLIGSASDFPNRDRCQYSISGVRCTVPEGAFFMMGDNRDNSLDSRYWGFVPEENVIGKAFFIWMNFGDLKRIGSIG